jgi:hypothetical protein
MPDAIYARTWNSPLASTLTRSPSWTRLEPQSVTGNPAVGLSAGVHDPLWLLARQWQFGEFAGEDAGTPLAVRIDAETLPITSWQPGDWTAAATPEPRPLDDDYPLDVLIERETISPAEGLRLRAEAGAALLTALRDAGLDDAADAVAQNAPLAADNDESGPAWSTLLPVLRGRCVDAKKIRTELISVAAGALPDWLDGPDRAAISAVTRRWLQWYRDELTPANEDTAWVGARLEYRYSLGAGEFTLRAPEAASGSADWWSFDAEAHALIGDEPAEPETFTHRSVATPLRFPGMPADRFWEFEDAAIDVGALEADPHDLARLLVAECALVFGCDWLQVPLDVPSGSLVTIGTVTYRTTFGETYRVASTTAGRRTPDEPWRMYTVTKPEKAWDRRGADADQFAAFDGLVIAPVSATRIEGTPVEEVVFVRDEAANLSWAVERIVADAAGDPRLRSTARHDPQPEPGDRVADAELDYLLQTSVPEWWIPFLPRVANRSGRVLLDLVRGAILKFGKGLPKGGLPVHAIGKFLNSGDQKVLFDAEVPRAGVRVQRVPMLSRRSDGSYDLWTARRVNVGGGEGRSGLAFDSAIPRAAPPQP